jgi:hypothetical protein
MYAYDAAFASSGKHYDMHPPAGAAVWLGERYDGDRAGDVFIAGGGPSAHAATDQSSWGETGETSILARMDLTGREYLFWTDHVLDAPINLGSTPTPEDDEVIKNISEAFKYHDGQIFEPDIDRYLYLNNNSDVSVLTGAHDSVWGDLYVSFQVLTPPANPASAVQVRAVLDTVDAAGKVTKSASLGTQELPYGRGQIMGFVPVPVFAMGDDQRLRFKVYPVDGARLQLSTGTFRGATAGS